MAIEVHSTPLGDVALFRLPPLEELLGQVSHSLHPDEQAAAEGWHPRRQRTFFGGRLALRHLLQRHGADGGAPVLHDERGAPTLLSSFDLSISHKDDLAVALLRKRQAGAFVGVDVELLQERKRDIAKHILTDTELRHLDGVDDDERAHLTLRTFSAKEALYKGLDRFVQRYVGFKEVAIDWSQTPAPVRFFLNVEANDAFRAEVHQLFIDDAVVSVVEVCKG